VAGFSFQEIIMSEQASVETVNPRIDLLGDLFNKAYDDGWLDANLGVVEKIIKLFPKLEPKYSKQRAYAIIRLKAAEYDRSQAAGVPPAAITEEQILAEMKRMEKEKQAKDAKKAK